MKPRKNIFARGLGKTRAILSKPWRRWSRPRWWYMLSRSPLPISPLVGIDRGTPIDRYFIEQFLHAHRGDIRGTVLEVKDRDYTVRFGGMSVSRSDVLDVLRDNPRANIYDDVRSLASIPDTTYDCFILTQVLQYVDDLDAALASIRRVLKVGGVALVSVPTHGKLDGHEDNVPGHFWRLTPDSARYIFQRHFTPDELAIKPWGNPRLAIGFLAGLAIEDLSRREIDTYVPEFTCGVLIRAVRSK